MPEWTEKFPKKPHFALVTEEGRYCRTCQTRKSADQFYPDHRSKDGLSWRCRECRRVAHAKWSALNADHVRDKARGSARKSRLHEPSRQRDACRRYRWKKIYGLTEAAVKQMLVAQNSKCGICDTEIGLYFGRKDKRTAHVDHCHNTDRVRGLLCVMCNTALGKFRDSPELLRKAASYIEEHGQRSPR